MSGDIEEFLRRAAERRKQQQGRRAPVVQPTPPPAQQKPISRPALRLSEVVDAEVVEADDISSRVARDLDTQKFEQRTSHLGEGIRGESSRLQTQIREDLGRGPEVLHEGPGRSLASAGALASTTDVAAVVQQQDVNINAKEIINMITNPRMMRHAILLNEILTRPENRW